MLMEAPDRVRGRPLPDLRLPATDGAEVALAGIDGTNVVVFLPDACDALALFWREDYVARRHAGLDRVIGVSRAPIDRLVAARARLDLPFHLLSDPADAFAGALGLSMRPVILILRDRRIVATHTSCTAALRALDPGDRHVAR